MFHAVVLLACGNLLHGLAAPLASEAAEPLPDVESVLLSASDRLHAFNERAAEMRLKMEREQTTNRETLTMKKHEYEASLITLDDWNANISATNTRLQKYNEFLKARNNDVEANLTDFQNNNRQLHRSLELLARKVDAANKFIAESVKFTDDTDAQALQVLASTTLAPTMDTILMDTKDEKLGIRIKKEAVLLQIPVAQSNTHEYIDGLANSIAEIRVAGKQAENDLQAQFEANLQASTQRQVALNATQLQLLQTRTTLLAHWASLQQAQEHLLASHASLLNRIDALHRFALKIDSVTGNLLDLGDRAKLAFKAPAAKNTTVLAAVKNRTVASAIAVAKHPKELMAQASNLSLPASNSSRAKLANTSFSSEPRKREAGRQQKLMSNQRKLRANFSTYANGSLGQQPQQWTVGQWLTNWR